MKENIKSKLATKWLFAMLMCVGLGALIIMGGCSTPEEKTKASSAEPRVELSIFAANSLELALPEVQRLYSTKHENVTFSDSQFKGSGDLVAQLEGGAKADILITASSATMDSASDANLIEENTRIDMFGNDLVVVRAQGSNIAFSDLKDVQSEEISRIAIGDAASVPAGTYANQSLSSIGLYSSASGKEGVYDVSISDKVALADKVGTAAQYVASGDCQVGFVYSSDVYRYSGIEVAFVTPADSHKAIKYPGAVCSSSSSSAEAQAFLDFCMNDPEAQKVWAKYGFELL